MNGIKAEVEDVYNPSYMNLSENFQSSPSTSSYFNTPMIDNTPIKIEQETHEEAPVVTDLDVNPPVKEPKKRGRPKKVKEDGSGENESCPKSKSGDKKLKQDPITDHVSVKKKRDRFNGMPEEEVLQRLLPDILAPNLDILIIGINPGLFAAYVGHHYAGPGNHFWKCLYLSGLIQEPMNAYDDVKLLKFGIGFTNICARTTRGISDLRRNEIREGGEILRKKIMKYRPKIAVFNGKGIYEVFANSKDFCIGKQPETVEGTDTILFVMPSSSARCAQLPRAVDKVPFYLALKKLRDYVRGDLEHLEDSEVTFPTLDLKMKSEIKFEKDDESSECLSELTLEQIQSRTEYLEALVASAEGREIPAERMARRRLRAGSDDEDNTVVLNFEDEESSQSSCSSELQRAAASQSQSQSQSEPSTTNQNTGYTLSKSLPGSSFFEVIPDVKEEQPFDPYEYGNACHQQHHSPEATAPPPQQQQQQQQQQPQHEKEETNNLNSRQLSPASSSSKSSPQLSQQQPHPLQVSTTHAGSHSPNQAYPGYSPSSSVGATFCPPPSVPGIGSGAGHAPPQSPMSVWQQSSPHCYPTGDVNSSSSGEGISPACHPMPYMPPTMTSPHHQPSPMHYHHMHSPPSNNPYLHQGVPAVPVSSPMNSVGHCGAPGQFKGRPPRYQWSNGSAGSHMMPHGPGLPHTAGNSYPPYAYARGSSAPCMMPYQSSGGAPIKVAPNVSSPPMLRSSLDKNVNKGVASYPSSHLPNFFTC